MTALISAEKFFSIQPASVILPHGEDGGTDAARIETALPPAAGVITAHLPRLPDGAGETARPVNPRFADAPEAVCADIALGRLTGTVTGSENTRNKYRESPALLEKINREYRGGLEGPGCRESEVIIAGKDGIPDNRFFKKGKVF